MSVSVEKLNISAKLKDGSQNAIVKDLSFSIPDGKRLAIVGQSGCGKTMTAMAILGLLPDNCRAEGAVSLSEKNLFELPPRARRDMLGTQIVYIPQSGADFLNPSLRVRSQMYETLKQNGVPKTERKAVAESLLRKVGFDDADRVLNAYPFQLSGGMCQRVVMAIASSGNPSLVIADEPTKGIDKDNTALFLQNLDKLFSGASVLLITHDISVAAECDRILVMRDGRLEEIGDTAEVLSHPASTHTHELICDLPHALSHSERGLI